MLRGVVISDLSDIDYKHLEMVAESFVAYYVDYSVEAASEMSFVLVKKYGFDPENMPKEYHTLVKKEFTKRGIKWT